MNDEQSGKELPKKYEKLTKEEQKDFWAGLLLSLILNNKFNTDRKETEDGE